MLIFWYTISSSKVRVNIYPQHNNNPLMKSIFLM
nr:MAG TPA: hypothetical protein [Caudoviricetes sp.]